MVWLHSRESIGLNHRPNISFPIVPISAKSDFGQELRLMALFFLARGELLRVIVTEFGGFGPEGAFVLPKLFNLFADLFGLLKLLLLIVTDFD